jgi:hypothetical protein
VRLAEIDSRSDLPRRSQAEVHALLLGLWTRRIRAFPDAPAFVGAVQTDLVLRVEVDRCLAALVEDPDAEIGAVASPAWRGPGPVAAPGG